MFIYLRRIAAMLMALAAAAGAAAGAVAHAAPIVVSPAARGAFEQTVEAADKGLQPLLRSRFAQFTALQESRRRDEETYKKLHYRNEEELAVLRGRIKDVHAAKLERLESELQTARARYRPLFDAYASHNRKVSLARSLGSKELTGVLRAQAEAMKPAVSLARQEIRTKEASLRDERARTARIVKAIRATLGEADALRVQLKAERSAVSDLSKRVTAAWTSFTQHARKREAAAVLDSLTALLSLSGQMADRQQRMTALENRIAAIHVKAKAQLPAE